MVVPGCHYGYRVHDGNSSTSSIERQAHYRDAVRRRAFERRQEDWWVQPRLGLMLRPERMTRMTGHAVESAVELTAIGLRGRAIRDSAQHLRGIWRYRDSWVPLIYSLMPRALLRRKRPGIDALRAERDQLRTMLP